LTVTFVKLSPPSASSREHLETSTNNYIHWTWESKMTVWPWMAVVPAAGRILFLLHGGRREGRVTRPP
jgi:hypothetical protein